MADLLHAPIPSRRAGNLRWTTRYAAAYSPPRAFLMASGKPERSPHRTKTRTRDRCSVECAAAASRRPNKHHATPLASAARHDMRDIIAELGPNVSGVRG